jgi:hypothetical protein
MIETEVFRAGAADREQATTIKEVAQIRGFILEVESEITSMQSAKFSGGSMVV